MGKIDKEKLLKELRNNIEIYSRKEFIDFVEGIPEEPFDIPVKRTWTLKKEFYDFAINMFQPISLMQTIDKEPKYKQYYDLHEEIDYSKIPKGSIVELKVNGKTYYKKLVKFECGFFSCETTSEGVRYDVYSTDNFVRIVELAKE